MKRFLPYISIGIFAFTILSSLGNFTKNSSEISLSEALSKIDTQKTSKINILNDSLILKFEDGTKAKSSLPNAYIPFLIRDLKNKNINFDFMAIDGQRSLLERIGGLLGFILSWLPMLVITWLIVSPFIRKNDDKNSKSKNSGGFGGFMGGGNPFNFGKSKARSISPTELKVTFEDVQGIDEAKQDIEELVDFLKDPMKYQILGGRIPKGCLLVGQPGTGKTLLAKAIASEAKVPFFFISGSDFVEMFVGVGASRVRDMFSQAKAESPCIVFIDEIDAVGRHRGIGIGGGNDEREQTLNQLLVEMDGFGENSGVVVLAATNRPDVLDTALLRPGRFDRQIYVNLPDIKGREKILLVHAKKTKLSNDVSLSTIAKGTPGFSGADLANLINEAALLAAKRNHKIITMQELEDAKDKILMGGERNLIMKEEERKLTAYHEAGHAIVAFNLKYSDPIHKITIIPRGRALGMVMRLPENDRVSMTRARLEADIAVAMGGRVAEEMIFGYESVTSGASSDIEQATKIATHMVIKWGLSDKIGNVNYGDDEGKISDKVSEEIKGLIDKEIKRFIEDAFDLAKKILKKNENDLHLLAEKLLKYETLTGDEVITLLKDKKDIRVNEQDNKENIDKKEKKGSIFRKKKQKE